MLISLGDTISGESMGLRPVPPLKAPHPTNLGNRNVVDHQRDRGQVSAPIAQVVERVAELGLHKSRGGEVHIGSLDVDEQQTRRAATSLSLGGVNGALFDWLQQES